MGEGREERPRPRQGRGGLMLYIAAWVGGGAAVAALVAVILHATAGDSRVVPARAREVRLHAATARAQCRLQPRSPSPAVGPGPAAHAGIRADALAPDALAGAVRQGLVVIEYRRRDVTGAALTRLEQLQEAVPAGTLLAPSRPSAADELTATSYRRRLACPRLTVAAFEALRLFHDGDLRPGPPARG